MIKKASKHAVHRITGNRKFYYSELRKFAPQTKDKIILEIGSGIKVKGKDSYSAKHIFKDAGEFICTDINPDFGHKVLDITKMNNKSKYDVILCLNVLEHVYDFQLGINNMYAALKKGGTLIVAVPFVFPLHDEPSDYWRFTEHSLRKMLIEFSHIDIQHQRSRRLPTGYFVKAVK